ncbi:hypothetical protein ACFQ0B_03790 [Nonomuraea thailandensis]
MDPVTAAEVVMPAPASAAGVPSLYRTSDRKRVMPGPSRLMATPLMMWSTPNVTVAMACRSPPSAPPSSPATSAATGPH